MMTCLESILTLSFRQNLDFPKTAKNATKMTFIDNNTLFLVCEYKLSSSIETLPEKTKLLGNNQLKDCNSLRLGSKF